MRARSVNHLTEAGYPCHRCHEGCQPAVCSREMSHLCWLSAARLTPSSWAGGGGTPGRGRMETHRLHQLVSWFPWSRRRRGPCTWSIKPARERARAMSRGCSPCTGPCATSKEPHCSPRRSMCYSPFADGETEAWVGEVTTHQQDMVPVSACQGFALKCRSGAWERTQPWGQVLVPLPRASAPTPTLRLGTSRGAEDHVTRSLQTEALGE